MLFASRCSRPSRLSTIQKCTAPPPLRDNVGNRACSNEEDIVDIVKGNMGWIEVVVGPMFSGKSEELIRRLRRAEFARQRVQIFKPAIDERYAANEIISHSGLGIPSDSVTKASEIMERVQPRTEVIGIDEAQFLGDDVVDVCTKLANLGKRVIDADDFGARL